MGRAHLGFRSFLQGMVRSGQVLNHENVIVGFWTIYLDFGLSKYLVSLWTGMKADNNTRWFSCLPLLLTLPQTMTVFYYCVSPFHSGNSIQVMSRYQSRNHFPSFLILFTFDSIDTYAPLPGATFISLLSYIQFLHLFRQITDLTL